MELGGHPERRRMVRSYLPDPIPREVVERIVATVRPRRAAGSARATGSSS